MVDTRCDPNDDTTKKLLEVVEGEAQVLKRVGGKRREVVGLALKLGNGKFTRRHDAKLLKGCFGNGTRPLRLA